MLNSKIPKVTSLMLRQEFEKRFDNLLMSYSRTSGRHELPNPPMKSSNDDDADEHRAELVRNSGQAVDLTRKKSSQQDLVRNVMSVASKCSKVQPISSGIQPNQSVRQNNASVVPKSLESQSNYSKPSTTASSQRRRDIEIQRLQEEYELQTNIDNERLMLERKALQLKELREKKLIEGKFRAMEEIVSVGSGTSVESRTVGETKRSVNKSSEFKESSNSDLVTSWILEQRKQNYHQDFALTDASQNLVSKVLGVDISVPVNERELRQLHREKGKNSLQRDEFQAIRDEVHDDHNTEPENQTFSIDQRNQNSRPLSSLQLATHRSQSNPANQKLDGWTNGSNISNANASRPKYRWEYDKNPIFKNESENPNSQQATSQQEQITTDLTSKEKI